jgi:hypothetical protein
MQQRILYFLTTITIHITADTFDQLIRFVASFNLTIAKKSLLLFIHAAKITIISHYYYYS